MDYTSDGAGGAVPVTETLQENDALLSALLETLDDLHVEVLGLLGEKRGLLRENEGYFEEND